MKNDEVYMSVLALLLLLVNIYGESFIILKYITITYGSIIVLIEINSFRKEFRKKR